MPVLPGPGRDRDMADDWRLKKKIVSLIGIVQERQDLTEQEAFDLLVKVKEQNDKLEALGIKEDAALNPFGGFGQPAPDPKENPPTPVGEPNAATDETVGTPGGDEEVADQYS